MSPAAEDLHLSLPAELANLPHMLALVDSASGQFGLTPEDAYDVRLAVDEMCTNLIRHGYQGMPPGAMSLRLRREPERLVVRLSDRGRACPPDAVPEPDLDLPWEQRPIGGLGWYLTREVMDSIDYETAPDGEHHLTLVKRLGPAATDAAAGPTPKI